MYNKKLAVLAAVLVGSCAALPMSDYKVDSPGETTSPVLPNLPSRTPFLPRPIFPKILPGLGPGPEILPQNKPDSPSGIQPLEENANKARDAGADPAAFRIPRVGGGGGFADGVTLGGDGYNIIEGLDPSQSGDSPSSTESASSRKRDAEPFSFGGSKTSSSSPSHSNGDSGLDSAPAAQKSSSTSAGDVLGWAANGGSAVSTGLNLGDRFNLTKERSLEGDDITKREAAAKGGGSSGHEESDSPSTDKPESSNSPSANSILQGAANTGSLVSSGLNIANYFDEDSNSNSTKRRSTDEDGLAERDAFPKGIAGSSHDEPESSPSSSSSNSPSSSGGNNGSSGSSGSNALGNAANGASIVGSGFNIGQDIHNWLDEGDGSSSASAAAPSATTSG